MEGMGQVDNQMSQYMSALISTCAGILQQPIIIPAVYTFFLGTAVIVVLYFMQRRDRGGSESRVQFNDSNLKIPVSILLLSNEEILKMNPADVVPLISSRLNSSLSPAENAQNLLRSLLISAKGLSETERLCIAYCMQVFLKKPEELTVPQSLLESHDPDAMGDEV